MRYFIVALMMLLSSSMAQAKTPFTPEAFQQAQANNELVLIDVYASWCPTCQKQSAVLADYFKQHPASQIKVFEVNFDEQKEWVTYFKAPRQSTLILFKGQQQVWFTVAETNTNRIFKALKQAEAQ
jgi:thiol-disulfide isomerase/thioredoxin